MAEKIDLYAKEPDNESQTTAVWGYGRDRHFVVWGQCEYCQLGAPEGVKISRRNDHGLDATYAGVIARSRRDKINKGYKYVGIYYARDDNPKRFKHLHHIRQEQDVGPEDYGDTSGHSRWFRDDVEPLGASLYF